MGRFSARSRTQSFHLYAPQVRKQEKNPQFLVLFVDWNRAAVLADVLWRLAEPPFVGQLNHTQQVAALRSEWREVRRRETKEAAAEARELHLEALRARKGEGKPRGVR
jgi:hypothetical protein